MKRGATSHNLFLTPSSSSWSSSAHTVHREIFCPTHLYSWFWGLFFLLKHTRRLSLSIHIHLLSSFKNSFTVFHHTPYQTYHNTLNQSPTHRLSCLQLFAVASSAMMNISAHGTALFVKEIPWATVRVLTMAFTYSWKPSLELSSKPCQAEDKSFW